MISLSYKPGDIIMYHPHDTVATARLVDSSMISGIVPQGICSGILSLCPLGERRAQHDIGICKAVAVIGKPLSLASIYIDTPMSPRSCRSARRVAKEGVPRVSCRAVRG